MVASKGVIDRVGGRPFAWTFVAMAALVIAGCGGDVPERQVDVEPTVSLPESIPLGQPFEIVYRWTPAEDFVAPDDDYKVFVHLVDPDNAILIQDDHFPPQPTSQWSAGQEVSYAHWIYPPAHLRPDYLDVYVGLYDDDGRVAVRSQGRVEGRPNVHRLYIRADDVAGIPVPLEGWYDEEVVPATGERWSWMGRLGVAAFGNPRGPAILHLRAHSPVDEIGGPQTVRVSIGEVEIASFETTDSTLFIERIEVPASALGEADWVEVTVTVDEVFVPAELDPASTDTRELGLQVHGLYLAAKSQP